MQIIELQKEKLETQAVEIIEQQIADTLKIREKFVLVLCGGNSVVGIFHKLKNAKIDWQKVHIFLVDERIVPITDDQSNFKNLQDNLISQIEIPAENIHAFSIEKGEENALKNYQKQFAEISGGNGADLILLSAGEDGHIASLFPYHDSIKNETDDSYIKVENSPKPPADRISLSRAEIAKSKSAILLFFGQNKYDAFQDFNNPLLSEIECLAKIVENIEKPFVLVDF
jgi:6-phosphogluconolactonase